MLTPIAFALMGFVAAVSLLTAVYLIQRGVERFARRQAPLRLRA